MRLMLIVVTIAVAMLLNLRVSQATQMPWCAGTSKGDFFSYNCADFAVRTRTTAGPNSFRAGPSGSDSLPAPTR